MWVRDLAKALCHTKLTLRCNSGIVSVLFQEIHESGNETAFLALSQPAIDNLTTEVNNLKDLELYWITPLAPSYWNNTDTTLTELITTQFNNKKSINLH